MVILPHFSGREGHVANEVGLVTDLYADKNENQWFCVKIFFCEFVLFSIIVGLI